MPPEGPKVHPRTPCPCLSNRHACDGPMRAAAIRSGQGPHTLSEQPAFSTHAPLHPQPHPRLSQSETYTSDEHTPAGPQGVSCPLITHPGWHPSEQSP